MGSGRASIAQRKDLKNEEIVENRTLCQNVLLLPFQTPQAPSSLHSRESTAVIDEVDAVVVCMHAGVCGERALRLDRDVEDEGDEDWDEE